MGCVMGSMPFMIVNQVKLEQWKHYLQHHSICCLGSDEMKTYAYFVTMFNY